MISDSEFMLNLGALVVLIVVALIVGGGIR